MLHHFQGHGNVSDDDSDEHEDRLEWKVPHNKNPTVTGIMDELRLQGDMRTLKNVRTFAARHFSEVSQLDSFLYVCNILSAIFKLSNM